MATIDSSGTALFSGTCTPVTCVTSFVSVSSGQVSWFGKLGTFSVSFTVGLTKPVLSPNPSMDLNIQSLTTTADGAVRFEWSDTNFTTPGVTGGNLQTGGLLTGNGTSTYRAYFDDSNTLFGTGIPAGSLGPYGPGPFSGSVLGPGPATALFAMTEVVDITLTAGSRLGVDFHFIALPSPLKLTCASATGEVGVPYSSLLMASGGVPPYTYSIASGSLPSGLTLNPATGAITGTPTQAGTFSFTGQVVDSSGSASNTVTSNCNIVVTTPPPLTVFCPLSTGQVGVPYNSAISASGGLPPYSYSISAGTLPDGLTLNPTSGAITGTPTLAGTFAFTAQVVDSRGAAAGSSTSSCNIVIAPAPPTLICASSTGQVGVFYNSALIAGGGAPPYTFSITAGALPPGLTLNTTTGAITGTPTSAGTFTFTAQVVDTRGNAAGTTTSSCSIHTTPPTIAVQCATSTGTVGAPYSSAFVASGGTAPYSYAITAGALPGGLTLNPSTGAITGTPTTAGTFNFTVTATDSTGGQAATTSSNCSIVIAPPTIAVVCITNTGKVGVPYSSAFVASGGTAPYSYAITAGALPGGLTLNPATGAVTGTPTTAGTFNFTVTATDSTGGQAATASSNCSIVIAPPTIAVTCITNTGTVGVPYSSAFVASGGTAPYTYAITAGALPRRSHTESGHRRCHRHPDHRRHLQLHRHRHRLHRRSGGDHELQLLGSHCASDHRGHLYHEYG